MRLEYSGTKGYPKLNAFHRAVLATVVCALWACESTIGHLAQRQYLVVVEKASEVIFGANGSFGQTHLGESHPKASFCSSA